MLQKLDKPIIAYKAFNKDMTCKDFQFEEGKLYHEDVVRCCSRGFHACLNPLDLFNYYYSSESVFHKVELSGEIDNNKQDSKVAASDIKILEEISLTEILEMKKDEIKKNIGVYDKIEYKNIGIATDKESVKKILSSGMIDLGNKITIIDGEYNYEWLCVHKEKNGKKIQYYFMMDTPIFSLLDYHNDITNRSFKDTWFNKNILFKLGESLENIFDNHLYEMEITEPYCIAYKTKITLPSIEERCHDTAKFVYFRICNNYNIDPFTKFSRADIWLRSVASSSDFCYAGNNGGSVYYHASGRSYVRPLIKIGK